MRPLFVYGLGLRRRKKPTTCVGNFCDVACRSAPRMMIVRSHLPWPLRWAGGGAGVRVFSAALAMWAFETGKGLAGLDSAAKEELSGACASRW